MTNDEWAGAGDLVCQILDTIYVQRRANFEQSARVRAVSLEQLAAAAIMGALHERWSGHPSPVPGAGRKGGSPKRRRGKGPG